MQNYNSEEIINVGLSKDLSIRDLAIKIKTIIGYEGSLNFDITKPDGTPRKLLDLGRLDKRMVCKN